ncbi:hypothetical protein [Flavobacterium degerlachei]|jgi:hypothetical protein|uniref:Uncharacterized protein n=1 Tax=Flavobacterium degerlachei TaxID=229203 RepID=A0A1H3AYN0_9FLAO|nr:hypothetical protein [Flavobacterium degerlachei]SDX34840.1 hypothetical protein SAMN05444338_109107 [Flavobacterium degerlachei]
MDEFRRIINMLLEFHIEQLENIGAEKEYPSVELKRCQYTIDKLGLFNSQITNAIELHFGEKELTNSEIDIIKEAFGEFCFAGMPKINYSKLQ